MPSARPPRRRRPPAHADRPACRPEAMRGVAEQFEGVFLAQVLARTSTQGSGSDQASAAAAGRKPCFASMLRDEWPSYQP